MNITIDVPEQLVEQLQAYAMSRGISINELTTNYWQEIVQDQKIDSAHQHTVKTRLSAYNAGETEAIAFEKFMSEVEKRIEKHELSR